MVRLWASGLGRDERDVWNTVSELRTEDVHVQPVPTQQRAVTSQVTYKGDPVTYQGKRVTITTQVQQVDWAGKNFDAFDLCDRELILLERFIREFHAIGR